jgi:acetyl esterase/lipase
LGAVVLCGIYGPRSAPGVDPDWDGLASNHVNPAAPPFLIVHGDADSVLAVAGARDFAQQLRTTSKQPVVYAELPGAQRTFDLFRSTRADCLLDAVDHFSATVMGLRQINPPGPVLG